MARPLANGCECRRDCTERGGWHRGSCLASTRPRNLAVRVRSRQRETGNFGRCGRAARRDLAAQLAGGASSKQLSLPNSCFLVRVAVEVEPVYVWLCGPLPGCAARYMRICLVVGSSCSSCAIIQDQGQDIRAALISWVDSRDGQPLGSNHRRRRGKSLVALLCTMRDSPLTASTVVSPSHRAS